MLLTLTTTHRPATDLGYLLHKNPARLQSVEVAGGLAHVFYPEATEARCTAALLLDLDPVALVRGARGNPGGEGFALAQYVNDRPYVASSFFSVALGKAFGTALNGTCKDRPDLPAQPLPFEATVAVAAAPGPDWPRRLFEPLGYAVELESYPLDPTVPEWGASPYFTLRLRHPAVRLQDLLAHLYVLLPVLDNDKHYYVGEAEAEKLLHRGGEWLPRHPERGFIARRYLRYRAALVNPALARLLEGEPEAETAAEQPETAPSEAAAAAAPAAPTEPAETAAPTLHDQRLQRVAHEIYQSGAKRVLDLGCGEGKLLRLLLRQPKLEFVLGMDVSVLSLRRAAQRLRLDEMPPRQRQRVELVQGSLLYHDARLAGFDAAAVVEVVEHLDPGRLAAFEQVLFGRARPARVYLTTPNAEYNALFEQLHAGEFRHADHRFEWTRAEFAAWAAGVAARHGYRVEIQPLGEEAEGVGAPSQLAVFTADYADSVVG